MYFMKLQLRLRCLLQLSKKLSFTLLIFLCLPVSIVKAHSFSERSEIAPLREFRVAPRSIEPYEIAQITPDESLPTNIEQLRDLLMEITGGEIAGDNLFHSFDEFSVPSGTEAVFKNADSIENIFARVTGDSISNIEGILSTQGDANLFLMNPNGIIFGEDAQLNVGGSFIGTTANGILFEDGKEFAASDTGDPLLSVEVPVGLGFTNSSSPITLNGNGDHIAGSITVNGNGNQIINDSSFTPVEFSQTPTGISLPDERTLALIGNGINLNGGVVTTKGGQIDLVSVGSGTVGINQTETGFTLFDDGVTKHQDINLNQQSLVDASQEPGGAISLTGQNINLKDASFLLSQNRGDSLGSSLDVTASESVNLSGQSNNADISSAIRAETLGTGEGGEVGINANQLNLSDSGRIQTATFGEGQGGNVNIQTLNNIQMNSGIISSITLGEADAGNIELSTSKLELNDTAVLTASTLGDGNGGEVGINANVISLDGTSGSSENRTNISSSSFRGGDGGNLNIDTRQLFIKNGASVGSTAVGTGSTGNVAVNASESIDISGSNPNFQGSDSVESSIRAAVQAPSGRPELPTGDSGNVTVNTSTLNVFQQGVVSVQNQGTGNAGTLVVNADDINLSDGNITAASASGQGGNINLDTDTLQLDSNSTITAEASQQGNGGNITINASNILAKKSSAVTANAEGGDGGNLDIDAVNLFLEAPIDEILSASSELGIDGTVEIEANQDFEGSFDLITPDFEIAEKALQGSCFTSRNSQQGSFVYGGTGGLPVSPDSMVEEEESTSSRLSQVKPGLPQPNPLETKPDYMYPEDYEWQPGDPIIEPTDLVKTKDGRLLWVNKEVQVGGC